MTTGWIIIYILDILLFVTVSFTVAYMTVFSVASLFSRRNPVQAAKRQNRFIILIPSYRQDNAIEQTVKTALGQTYPQRLFDITVISDHQKEITNFHLAQYPITLLTPNFKTSTKAKSLQLAINNLPQFKIYDVAIVLDAGTVVEPEFLQQMNDAFETAGTKAIQAHRLSKNRDTAIANLDAIFEEINNSIFRRGHITLGISSAISGSGIAYDFKWFKENIMTINTGWEDKEIEARLMRQHIYVDYFDHIHVYDEKTRTTTDFNRQRSRWASTQLRSLISNIRYLPSAILQKKYDFVDKIMQWMLIPRTIMVAIMALMSIILPFIYFTLAVKWWVLFAFIMLIFAIATPDYLVDDRWDRSFVKAPFIMLSSILNLPNIKLRKKRFEHNN
ncbi:MAG: glycosyltransferase [Prevotella sp.]|nr:glycosyltransferase [Prevotella sp.]